MATLFSKRFLGALVNANQVASGTVPSGVIWIVRSICCTTTGTGQTGCAVTLNNAVYIWAVDGSKPGVTQFADVHQVLNAGEQLFASAGSAAAFFMVSGYELVLP